MQALDTVAMMAQGQRLVTLANEIEHKRDQLRDMTVRWTELHTMIEQLDAQMKDNMAELREVEAEAARLMGTAPAPAALSDENYPCRACGKRIDLGDVCDACWAAEQQLVAEVDAAIGYAREGALSLDAFAELNAPGKFAWVCTLGPEAHAELQEAAAHDHALDMAELEAQGADTDDEGDELQPGEPDRLARNCPVCAAEYADSHSTCPDCRRQAGLAEPVDLDDEGTRQAAELATPAASRKCSRCDAPAAGKSSMCSDHWRSVGAGRKPSAATLAKREAVRQASRKDLHWSARDLGNAKRGTTEAAALCAKVPISQAALIERLVAAGHGDRGAIIEVVRQAVARGVLVRDGANVVAAAQVAEVAK